MRPCHLRARRQGSCEKKLKKEGENNHGYGGERRTLIRRNTLGDLLRRNARRNPAKTAVIFGSQSLSDREWNEHVNQVARGCPD